MERCCGLKRNNKKAHVTCKECNNVDKPAKTITLKKILVKNMLNPE